MPKAPKPIKTYQLYVFRYEKTDNITTNNTPVTPVSPLPPNPNDAINFGTMKSDEEIVYGTNYKYNLNIDTLINNSNSTRLAQRNKKRGTKKVPRCQNAWILYRRDKNASPEFIGLKSGIVSIIIREMWKNETKEVRELFSALSNLALKRHVERYGNNYKYKPNQRKNQKKPKQKKGEKEEKRQTGFKEIYQSLDCENFNQNMKNATSIEPINPIIPSDNQLKRFDNDNFIIQEPFTPCHPEPTLHINHSFSNYSHHFNLRYNNFTADMNDIVSIDDNNDELSFNEYIHYEDPLPN